MRRNLVEAALAAASVGLFEDVLYAAGAGLAVPVKGAIAGVEKTSDRLEVFGQAIADCPHVTRALKAKFPTIAKGDTINDGVTTYRVLAWEPVGDGRFEIAIGLKPI